MPVQKKNGNSNRRRQSPRPGPPPRNGAAIPWPKLPAVIEPFYPKGVCGRPPIGLARMLGGQTDAARKHAEALLK